MVNGRSDNVGRTGPRDMEQAGCFMIHAWTVWMLQDLSKPHKHALGRTGLKDRLLAKLLSSGGTTAGHG